MAWFPAALAWKLQGLMSCAFGNLHISLVLLCNLHALGQPLCWKQCCCTNRMSLTNVFLEDFWILMVDFLFHLRAWPFSPSSKHFNTSYKVDGWFEAQTPHKTAAFLCCDCIWSRSPCYYYLPDRLSVSAPLPLITSTWPAEVGESEQEADSDLLGYFMWESNNSYKKDQQFLVCGNTGGRSSTHPSPLLSSHTSANERFSARHCHTSRKTHPASSWEL